MKRVFAAVSTELRFHGNTIDPFNNSDINGAPDFFSCPNLAKCPSVVVGLTTKLICSILFDNFTLSLAYRVSCSLENILFCFSTGLVQLYIAGLPLRSCQTIGAPSVQGSAQGPFFSFLVAAGFEPTFLSLRSESLNRYPIGLL